MLKYYLAKYKDCHKSLRRKHNEKRLWYFWMLFGLYILSFIIFLVISIMLVLEVSITSINLSLIYWLFLACSIILELFLSILDNKWRIKKVFVNFNDYLDYCRELRKTMEETFRIHKEKHYKSILKEIKTTKGKLSEDINKPRKLMGAFIKFAVLGLIIGVAPTYIQGLMDNNTEEAHNVAINVAVCFLVLLMITIAIWTATYIYSLIMQGTLTIYEDFESDIQVIIDDMNGYYDLNTPDLSEK